MSENSQLKTKVEESKRSVEEKEYKIMDLELNVNGLRETLRDIQVCFIIDVIYNNNMFKGIETWYKICIMYFVWLAK